jgi:hypothetical protein
MVSMKSHLAEISNSSLVATGANGPDRLRHSITQAGGQGRATIEGRKADPLQWIVFVVVGGGGY